MAPLPTTMEAAITVAHGGPEVIEFRTDVPTPQLDVGQALVRVTAAAVNNTDIWSREGRYGTAEDPDAVAGWKGVPLTFPLIQGIDVAGVVVAMGHEDDSWVGRRVIVDPSAEYRDGLPNRIVGSEVNGGFAQFIACGVEQLRDVTASPLTDAQLGCLSTAYGTALGMLNRARCDPSERVLVTGSSGGVGMAAIQLLLARGCEVTALTSASKVDLVRAAGVTELSVRGRDRLADVPEVDVVVDVVGGDEFGEVVDRLRDGGRLVTAGAIAGPVVALDLRRLYLRQRTLIGSTMHTPSDFADLAEIARNGALEPVVAHIFPLDQIGEAQRRFVEKDFVGKLVLDPWASRSVGAS